MSRVAKVQLSDFDGLVGSSFFLSTDESETRTEVELVEAKPIRMERFDDSSRQPFCLLIKCPPDSGLVQRMYRVENESIGILDDLFLVPIKQDADGLYLEAVFS